ncbi:MAG: hypothetical protein H7X88_04240 [Gloeobacteraceae cyanobacterium ES-bin-316]|nr:hypothetical protein [Ferruginibacter sp.]
MKKLFCSLLVMMSVTVFPAVAQNGTQYKLVDDFVIKLGSLDSQNVAQIAEALTLKLEDKEQKARAIFFWIANNIALDAKAIKINDERKSLPEDVVKQRKATPLGFAKLFQEMSSLADIRCLVVDGYIKTNIEDLNSPADEINHSWNVLQLGPSPDKWFFVDAALATGTLDKKQTVFTKDFTSAYFFASRSLFNLDHYPDNDAWQLGGGPKSLKEFYSLPVFYSAAYLYDIKKPTPANGFIKTKSKGKTNFIIPYGAAGVSNVSLIIGDGRKQQKPEAMNFTASAGSIVFNYQFKTEDTFPVKIVVDGKTVLEYMVEVSE